MPARSYFDSSSLPDLRTQFGAQVDFLDQVSHHALDTTRQLSELNVRCIMALLRQIIDDGIRLGRALLACNDPLQAGAIALRSWQASLVGVLASSGATLAHDANDGGWQAARRAAGGEDFGAAHNPT